MATQLPDGTVVQHPPGKRGAPQPGLGIRRTGVAVGVSSGKKVVLPNQKGRRAVGSKER